MPARPFVQGRRRFRDRTQHRAGRSATLVWIDDYQPFLNICQAIFEDAGYKVLTASKPHVGIDLVTSNQVDAVVVDYEMPEMNGEAVASVLKKRHPEVPIVMCSGSLQLPDRMMNLVDAVCDKAGSREDLLCVIQHVIQNRQNFRSATPVCAV